MMNEVLLLQVLAFPVTAALIVFLRRHATQLGVVDAPGGRKQHHGVIPLVGGLGMFGGLMVAAWADGVFEPRHGFFFAAVSLLVATGYVDDRHDLRPRVRFVLQAIAASIMVWGADIRLENFGNLFGFGDVTTGALAGPITVFAVLGVINAMNMIDGVDGLAGGIALIALLVFGGFVAATGQLHTTLLLPLIAGIACEITVKWAGTRPDNPLVKVLLWPGLQMQRLTTAEPDDAMVEVAVAAMSLVVAREQAEAAEACAAALPAEPEIPVLD